MLVDDDKAKDKSLPSRERGLKLCHGLLTRPLCLSLPSRERGLKLCHGLLTRPLCLSLPSRERGLKSSSHKHMVAYKRVAPFTGAWIEMPITCLL